MRQSLIRLFPVTLATLSIAASAHEAGVTDARKAASTPQKSASSRFRVGAFQLILDPASQTARGLSPVSTPDFDFLPIGRAKEHSGNGYNHLGDIHLRLRQAGGAWQDFSSARERRPVRALPTRGAVLAAADIGASMGTGLPLRIVREWVNDKGPRHCASR